MLITCVIIQLRIRLFAKVLGLIINHNLSKLYKFISRLLVAMNIAAEDACHTEFENLKFRKTPTRSISFKIDKEKIVLHHIYLGY